MRAETGFRLADGIILAQVDRTLAHTYSRPCSIWAMNLLLIFLSPFLISVTLIAEQAGPAPSPAGIDDFSYYNPWMLAATSVPRRSTTHLGMPPLTPEKVAAARDELRRRPGVTEFMVSAIEKTGEHTDPSPYFAALGRSVETTPEQKRRIMRMIRSNLEQYQEFVAGRAERREDGFGLVGATEFLGANPGRESEQLLTEMLFIHGLEYHAPAILSESGSAAALPHLQKLLEATRARPVPGSTYLADVEGWVAQLEGRILSGDAPASFPVTSSIAPLAPGKPGSRRTSEGETASFWSEPFVWGAAALVLGAGIAAFWSRRQTANRK